MRAAPPARFEFPPGALRRAFLPPIIIVGVLVSLAVAMLLLGVPWGAAVEVGLVGGGVLGLVLVFAPRPKGRLS
ncbi:MAG: hypothetical protein KGJ23_11305 [Euryarchaeota archaeon]|nr:hypothetical protein [Euryarchaeota archaeon]MDE1837181.1 hypothetical protein [Euryarchaeota archaeon]MDE1881693.1 hypothetical protein [Euryarchaeota archaeon]MDE2045337.1 hypothetical protein [Thermoplasmata archaeon]